MSKNELKLIHIHLKPFMQYITGVDMELAATAFENLVEELIAGQINPNDLMMLFHRDRLRFPRNFTFFQITLKPN